MSAPLDGSIYVSGRTITLGAKASDSDGDIAQVEFFQNGNSLGFDTTAPYTIIWPSVPEGTHMLTAVATDDTGVTTTSAAIDISVTPPGDLHVLQDGLGGYAGTADTFLHGYFTTVPLGRLEELDSLKNRYNPLVRFAIFSNEGGPVPEGATVTFATLALHKSSFYDYTYRAHPVLTEWSENQATWLNATDEHPWEEPGGAGIGSDYAANGSPEAYVGWDPGWLELDVTDSVQSMSLGQQTNNGWQLIAVTGNNNAKSFHASEYTNDPTLRPKLIIHYQLDANVNLRPAVALTAPGEGTTHLSSEAITLSANAEDPDGSVTQVEFFYDNASLGVDTTAPYTLTWNDAPVGTYRLTAVATDDADATTTSAAVTISVLNDNARPDDTIVLQDGLGGYAGTADTFLHGYFTTVPYGRLEELDSLKNRYNPLVRFAIFSNEGGPVPEGATVTSATLALHKSSFYNYTYRAHPVLTEWSESQATWLEATDEHPWEEPGGAGIGSDYAANGSPEAYVGWDPGWLELDVTDSVQSMSLGQQTNNGWQLIAVTGNNNAKSFHASEYTNDPTLRPKLIIHYQLDANVNLRPAVALTAPGEGTTHLSSEAITLSANAEDPDGSVTQVEFFYDNASLGVDTTAPYTLTWNDAPVGTYRLTAVATDDADATTTSAAVTISVLNDNARPDDTIVLQDGLGGYAGTADTFLHGYFTTVPYGRLEELDSLKNRYNPLVRFAIFSNEGGPVPEGATVTSATLALHKSSFYNYTYRAHPVLTEWSESQATWLEATDEHPWEEPGGAGIGSDYAANGSPEAYVGWDPGWLELDVTDSVQSMSLGQQTNNGWQLIAVTGNNNGKSFYAREYTDDPTLRPKLIIHYQM